MFVSQCSGTFFLGIQTIAQFYETHYPMSDSYVCCCHAVWLIPFRLHCEKVNKKM